MCCMHKKSFISEFIIPVPYCVWKYLNQPSFKLLEYTIIKNYLMNCKNSDCNDLSGFIYIYLLR